MDESGKLFILQTRPLRISPTQKGPEEAFSPDIPPDQLLIDWGVVASSGVGARRFFLVKRARDLISLSRRGSLLVDTVATTKYVDGHERAAAIITDMGGARPNGHPWPFQVPTIVDPIRGGH